MAQNEEETPTSSTTLKKSFVRYWILEPLWRLFLISTVVNLASRGCNAYRRLTTPPPPVIEYVFVTATPGPSPTPDALETQTPPCRCTGNLYNCNYFSHRRAAQTCFIYCMQQGYGDVHFLDEDNDGHACEGMP